MGNKQGFTVFKERERKFPYEEEFLGNVCDIKINLELKIDLINSETKIIRIIFIYKSILKDIKS